MKQKVRKESGRSYNKFYDPDNGFYNIQYWNDWNDYRDGWRNAFHDNSLFQPVNMFKEHWADTRNKNINNNIKLKKLLCRRELMKYTRTDMVEA